MLQNCRVCAPLDRAYLKKFICWPIWLIFGENWLLSVDVFGLKCKGRPHSVVVVAVAY